MTKEPYASAMPHTSSANPVHVIMGAPVCAPFRADTWVRPYSDSRSKVPRCNADFKVYCTKA